jgi:hypothetical protein
MARRNCRSAECLLLAQSGHPRALNQCPLLGVKRKRNRGRAYNRVETAGLGWRNRFRQNRIKNDVAKKVFEAGHRHLKTLSSSSDLTNTARESLSMAKRIVLGPAFQRQSELSWD